MNGNRRLIEDFLPIKAISAEAGREKSVRKGHISTLHLWWARRPLVACRAAVYGALVPASRFVPENGPDNKKQSLGRANAAKFVAELCKYPGNPLYIKQAQEHILEAHAERLTAELEEWHRMLSHGNDRQAACPTWVDEFKWPKDKAKVTRADIEAGRAPRPRVLDMFAGGGAIPLEALRLGCEAYALDLNPVAHIIELCTLVYPQKYGKADPTVRGMTGPKNDKGETTWGGLAKEVRYWGNWVLEQVRREIGDLYPPVPDPDFWSGTGCQPVGQNLPLFPGVKHGVAKTQRHLPHWEKDGGCYFITWRTAPGIELSPEARSIVLDNLTHWSGNRYDLWQAVVMPDHVHVLLSPLPKDGEAFWSLSEIIHTAKSYTANEINRLMDRSGSLWQEERFDHIVRNPASFEEKWCYIRHNPLRRGLAKKAEDYLWLYEDDGLAAHPTLNDGLAARPTLTPVAYLWTRTVKCKNPACGATVPLVRQTWLCKKANRYVALKIVAPKNQKQVHFEVVESRTEKELGFDPAGFSKGGNATCPFCGTVADSDYVKAVGRAASPTLSTEKRNDSLAGCPTGIGMQLMAVVCTRQGRQGKIYISATDVPEYTPDEASIRKRIEELCQRTGLTVPNEPMDTTSQTTVAGRGFGITRWSELFTPRQMLCLLTFAAAVRKAVGQAASLSQDEERHRALGTYLAVLVNRQADYNSSLARWHITGEKISGTFGRQALPMVWDFAELAPFGGASGSPEGAIDWIVGVAEAQAGSGIPTHVTRGSAMALPWGECQAGSPTYFDAVITDPPYYDNVDYAKLSDFFYVWLKRTIASLYPEHFATDTTPKKSEAVADPVRHGGSKDKARRAYEDMMAQSFREAYRVLKPEGQLTVVYAHKSTLGWATLVDALRQAGFSITEAWPLNTEMKSRLVAMDSAALASSIFLIGRKRDANACTGSYETHVRAELEEIVRERVKTLWDMGITGADLVIACVGAGLRAFTRFARVEYANGEEVPAEKFLAEVETVVLESILARLSKDIVGRAASPSSVSPSSPPQAGSLSHVDPATRFYILWRYTYKTSELDAGEAIVFANGTHVELEGPGSLTHGSRALVEKKKAKYRLKDFADRGGDEKLGLPDRQAGSLSYAPLIDALHRTLWLMENRPRLLPEFLRESGVNREAMRLVAQALAGPALKGGEMGEISPSRELAALTKITANWQSVVEDAALTAEEKTDMKDMETGQMRLKL